MESGLVNDHADRLGCRETGNGGDGTWSGQCGLEDAWEYAEQCEQFDKRVSAF